jgi:hypothetical protein
MDRRIGPYAHKPAWPLHCCSGANSHGSTDRWRLKFESRNWQIDYTLRIGVRISNGSPYPFCNSYSCVLSSCVPRSACFAYLPGFKSIAPISISSNSTAPSSRRRGRRTTTRTRTIGGIQLPTRIQFYITDIESIQLRKLLK